MNHGPGSVGNRGPVWVVVDNEEGSEMRPGAEGSEGVWPAGWPWPPDAAPVRGERGMVATTDRYATEAGVEVLRSGGNAVDAAVAVALALAVVNPEAGNLGGGGFAVVRTPAGTLHALDFRSTAPAASSRDMFFRDGAAGISKGVGEESAGTSNRAGDAGAETATGAGDAGAAAGSVLGHLAVAVPGSVRGLHELHDRLGRKPWAELVEPAVALARGFTVRERLARSYPRHIVEGLARFPESAAVFLPGGAPPGPGDIFRQPDLVRTLERIRDEGAAGFYEGETAARIEAEMVRGGGVVTAADLAAYRARWREPIRFRYRGHTVVSMPPSSSGGVTLAETAHILARLDLGAVLWHGAGHVHHLAEAWRRAFADRNHLLADPAFADVPLETLLDPEYGRWRGETIRDDQATPSEDVGPGVDAYLEGDHTTHLSVVDAEGGAVALTTTLNTWYGSKVVAAGTGVLLNNEMDDLSTRPGAPNHFGLIQGEANAVAPGKRPLSAMSPTLVLDGEGELRMVLGNAGGATIITTVFQILSGVLDHGLSLAAALRAPRVHHQHLPDRIQVEPGGLEPEVVEALRAMGHAVEERDEMSGDAHAVAVAPDGSLEGVSDPRRGGTALGV